ncbi:MAG: alkaline phosphatase family protein [Thermoleophilaceae bacterium]
MTALSLAVVALAAALWAGLSATARAGADACNPRCVMVIQVDGLEPKDVTPQTTPFLWALGHQALNLSTNDQAIDPAANSPGITGRAGFTWQAGRSVMTAGTAPATASLLTGGYSEQTQIPSSDYLVGGNENYQGSFEFPLVADQNDFKAESIFASVNDDGKLIGAFVGDPGLANVVTHSVTPPATLNGSVQDTDDGVFWVADPTREPYCTPPRDLNPPTPSSDGSTQPPPQPNCVAPDAQTLDNALTGLTTDPNAGKVKLAYIQLAELGAVKRLYGDTDGATVDAAGAPQGIPAVQDALHSTDAAIGEFVARYSQDTTNGQVKWPKTVMFVVGDHGYESTPLAQRVPDPADPSKDLADYVRAPAVGGTNATLVSQGTIGTIYYRSSDPAEKSAALARIRTALLAADGPNGSQACAATGGCIDKVLYVRDDALAGGNVVPADWHLDYPGTTTSGDLVVVTKPGWALGREAPLPTTESQSGETVELTDVVNPFNASDGGPRNRAIFALANGPDKDTVQPLLPSSSGGGRYPVTKTAANPDSCPTPTQADAVSEDVNVVNAAPGDDADAPGHECQPETVDFAPTIAALLAVNIPERQQVGRFLQEAFTTPLSFPKEEELPPQELQPEPAAPAVEIYVPPPPPPPPPPKGFDFSGLVRGLRAQVVDANGCSWSLSKAGTKLDYLKIEADFGKQLSAVTLTFYTRAPAKKTKTAKQSSSSAGRFGFASSSRCPRAARAGATASAAAPRTQLKAIARFKPFTVQRGHVKLKLKVPDQFKPSYVGVTVQEAKKVARARSADTQQANFAGIGPMGGGVFAIADAKRLHARKGKGGH